jgi:hypothetical protein
MSETFTILVVRDGEIVSRTDTALTEQQQARAEAHRAALMQAPVIVERPNPTSTEEQA